MCGTTTISANAEQTAKEIMEKQPLKFRVTDKEGNVFLLKSPVVKIESVYEDTDGEIKKHGFSWSFNFEDDHAVETVFRCWVFNHLLFENKRTEYFLATDSHLSLFHLWKTKNGINVKGFLRPRPRILPIPLRPAVPHHQSFQMEIGETWSHFEKFLGLKIDLTTIYT
jgi:hypothetical protein